MSDLPCVLVTEDEALIREILEATLEDAGFGVKPAANGSQAIALLESDPGAYCALLTDVDLGKGPNGWDVARRARELSSNLPVVYMSGGSGMDWTSQGVPNSVLIAKPFANAQVVTAITTLLNTGATSPSP